MSDGSGTSYAAGATYTANEAATLYAQWKDYTTAFTWDTTDQLEKSINVKTTGTTTINWGDGVTDNIASSSDVELTLTHTYTSAGDYTVKILNDVVTSLNCNSSQISSIDVSNAVALTSLDLGINNVSDLDVSHNTALTQLVCGYNQITSLDVSNNLLLTSLTVENSNVAVLVTDSRQNITTLTKASGTKVVTVTQTPHGRIEYAGGYKFNIIPNAGYAIETLFAGGVAQTVTGTYDFRSLVSDTTITATFSQIGVGNYVAYSAGGYTGDWVVLRNSTGQLEIISKESVGNVTLSGEDGYANAVATLNAKSQQYVNPSYAVAGRSVGATADSIGMIDTTQYPLNYGVSGYPYTDTYYTDDETLITGNTVLRHSGDPVWLASRYLTTDSTHTLFNVRFIGADASVSGYYPYFVNNGTAKSIHTITNGVRPVITLRGNVKTTGGSETQGNPYTIGF